MRLLVLEIWKSIEKFAKAQVNTNGLNVDIFGLKFYNICYYFLWTCLPQNQDGRYYVYNHVLDDTYNLGVFVTICCDLSPQNLDNKYIYNYNHRLVAYILGIFVTNVWGTFCFELLLDILKCDSDALSLNVMLMKSSSSIFPASSDCPRQRSKLLIYHLGNYGHFSLM